MEFSWQNRGAEVTVAHFLQQQGLSKHLCRQLKWQGKVWVAEQPARLNDRLPVNAVIKIKLPAERGLPQAAISLQPLSILYETAHWLVINKPANVASVPGPQTGVDTIVSRVRGYLLQQGSENIVPHLLSRLDYATSGVLLVAKHAFAQSRVDLAPVPVVQAKIYLAVVAGRISSPHGLITLPLGRCPTQIAGVIDLKGRPAQTEFWTQAYLPALDATILQVKLHSGRRHQIRVHLQAVGHPLLGDDLYGGPMKSGISRQALHAWQLIFRDPFTQKTTRINAPIPQDLQRLLKNTNIQYNRHCQ
ncbi:RluA family pseudouridine synthase [Loigolactobacillus binensis]|uniref:RNA pseudouridylate synthase n=1 Tax=Loigolactobacillus binensis TaxID=2559922 RepID=A0ABW3EBU6_9LACO|nr:RluA family pseudouridine synthase [Loigolactobacillus binensis]